MQPLFFQLNEPLRCLSFKAYNKIYNSSFRNNPNILQELTISYNHSQEPFIYFLNFPFIMFHKMHLCPKKREEISNTESSKYGKARWEHIYWIKLCS